MKLSIIWKLSEKEEDNQVTLECLQSQLADYEDGVQLLIYPDNKDQLYDAEFQMLRGMSRQAYLLVLQKLAYLKMHRS